MPITEMKKWLSREKELGSPSPDRAVLATAAAKGAHSRVVVIREITQEGLLFFAQKGTRKVAEMAENPHASMTLWLALQQRQIVVEGPITPLSHTENEAYWRSLPKERQLRFSVCAPTVGQPIQSINELESRFKVLEDQYNQSDIPMNTLYCGFRLKPDMCYFYTLGNNTFPEIRLYTHNNETWQSQMLCP